MAEIIATGLLLLSLLIVVLPARQQVRAHSGSTEPRTWYVNVAVESEDQAIQGQAFLPGELWINAGDSIVWTAQAAEVHTVTFLAQGMKQPLYTGAQNQIQRVGGSIYDGKSYYNSGLLSNRPGAVRTYKLTFNTVGNFPYHCLVHPTLKGMVHVNPRGKPYPFSQEEYDRQSRQEAEDLLQDGSDLADDAWDDVDDDDNHVIVGTGNLKVAVVRFFPQEIVVHVGDTVTFTNRDPAFPHTVTFGAMPKNGEVVYGNPRAFDGSAPLNSGYLGARPRWPLGPTFWVKFTRVGHYTFYCVLHKIMNMTLQVTVLP